MKRIPIVFAAAVFMAAALSSPADAHCRGCGTAAGIVGGLAAGAIIGSAIANSGPVYGEPAPVYVAPPPPPAYVEPSDVAEGDGCRLEHRRLWIEGYGWRTRRVEVCD
ncbi:MAG TPA: hypothetical protein VFP60_02135 [Pseudolabrys sp.]|nr:hypothetical protein [Pseudolabrys sp.]